MTETTKSGDRPFGSCEGLALEFKNPNVPHGRGLIDPAHFTPYPKNPTLCKFLIQLGRYEELGSGVNNVTKYLPFYAPGAGVPTFDEEDMFITVVPLAPTVGEAADQVEAHEAQVEAHEAQGPLSGVERQIMEACFSTPKTAAELLKFLGYTARTGNFKRALARLLSVGLVEMSMPDKPRSRNQKYRLTGKGKKVLEEKK